MSELAAQLFPVKEACRLGDFRLSDVQIIQKLTHLYREQRYRESIDESVFRNLLEILTKALDEIQTFCMDANRAAHLDVCLQFTAECFRCQRNACVQCTRNQTLMSNLGFINVSVAILQLINGMQSVQADFLSGAFRCGLQFLGNLAAGNRDSQDRIWKLAFPDLFLYLTHRDEKAVAYCAMVLFTCLDAEKVKGLKNHEKGPEVALAVLDVHRKYPELDWALLIVTDHILKSPELVKDLYAKLSNRERVTLLELILTKLCEKDLETKADVKGAVLPFELAKFLVSCFLEKYKAVLHFASDTHAEDEEALIVIRLLDILCEMTSNHEKFGCLQTFFGLLDSTVDILQQTHLAGKQSKNIFSTSQSCLGSGEVSHPAVGFKASLIRLIGNLCYKNKENQDKVFELDGIPLILDNCSIDDNNPFVSQWAIFAIRNLTEQNLRNQELIAKMECQGQADDSLLRSMGLQVEKRDGKLVLRSQERDS
ncbi:ataxin-10 isoform X2 [Latimeria chalumnae]|uniref:ataxin-10 isoform X2 n=1 Tax=Latimeria chalumnae TaxID=7897 RepID=UPI00313BD5B8